jgi:hypothetical protein
MRRLTFTLFALFSFAYVCNVAVGQEITSGVPIHARNYWQTDLPLQTWECSSTQLATIPPTNMLEFRDVNGLVNGYVDCHGNIHGSGGSTCPGAGASPTQILYDLGGACAGILGSVVVPPQLSAGGGTSFNGTGLGNIPPATAVYSGTPGEINLAYSYVPIFGNIAPYNAENIECLNTTGTLGGGNTCTITPPAYPGSSGCLIHTIRGWLNVSSPIPCGTSYVDDGSAPGDGDSNNGSGDSSGYLGSFSGLFGPPEWTLDPLADGFFNAEYEQEPNVLITGNSNNGYASFAVEVSGIGAIGQTMATVSQGAEGRGINDEVYAATGSGASQLLGMVIGLNNNDPDVAVPTGIGLTIAQPDVGYGAGGGTFTTMTGLYIQPQCAAVSADAANCMAIQTGLPGLADFGDGIAPGIVTLANINTEGPIEGYLYNCSDCDTPVTEGATCSSSGDHAGALAIVLRSVVHCF